MHLCGLSSFHQEVPDDDLLYIQGNFEAFFKGTDFDKKSFSIGSNPFETSPTFILAKIVEKHLLQDFSNSSMDFFQPQLLDGTRVNLDNNKFGL